MRKATKHKIRKGGSKGVLGFPDRQTQSTDGKGKETNTHPAAAVIDDTKQSATTTTTTTTTKETWLGEEDYY
jgi:hypothetical protein